MNKLIKLALDIAKQSLAKKYNLVAIVTDKKNKILSIGMNSYNKTHPLQAKYAKKVNEDDKIYLHAEIDALVKCKGKPHKIYIARANKKGEPQPAKPCKICKQAIKEAGIEKVYYT